MATGWMLQRKINAVLILCGVVFIGFTAPVVSYYSFQAYKSEARAQQARLVEAVRTSAAIAAFVGNETIAGEVLSGLLQDDEISAAELRGQAGFVRRALGQGRHAERLDVLTQTVYPLLSPVDAREQVGALVVWSNDPLIAQRARADVWLNILLLVALSLAMALASMAAVNLLVGRPLRHLADAVGHATPETTERIAVAGRHQSDEIGLVANSVNGFLAAMRKALDKERALRAQIEKMNRHFSRIFAHSHVGILVLDEGGHVLHHNPVVFERLIRLEDDVRTHLEQADLFGLAFGEHAGAVRAMVRYARQSGQMAEAEVPLAAAWQSPCWVHLMITVSEAEEHEGEVIECVIYDVTARVMEAKQAKMLAERDPLTGALNRRGLELFLDQQLRHPESARQLVVMLIDLDGFKPVNDHYGHQAGDLALKSVADRLQASVRGESDKVARLGGDEFVVCLVMPEADRALVERVARKMLEAIRLPVKLHDGSEIRLGASIGVAFGQANSETQSILEAADEAMYAVKHQGKNNVAFASLTPRQVPEN